MRPLTACAVFATVVLAGWAAGGRLDLSWPRLENTRAPIDYATEPVEAPRIAVGEHGVSGADGAIVDAAVPAPRQAPQLQTPFGPIAFPSAADPPPSVAAAVPSETPEQCLAAEGCVDRYLFAVYERAPKVDSVKMTQQTEVTVKKKGKTRTITKTIEKLVDENFAWKDPIAATKAGMSLQDYVIGGMDPTFKLTLYRALRAMDGAGLAPGITSAFRDDYRQSLASGLKAATNRSFHGGSLRGGYGHGVAADLVSVNGETRAARLVSSEALWKWIDAHGAEFGIARPYLDRDPPHVAPLDGEEYAMKRGNRAKTKVAAAEPAKHGVAETTKRRVAETTKPHVSAKSDDHGKTKSARTSSKAKSI
jgi:hypothetical protein